MFRGRYEHTLDEKGRISIPIKFRDLIKNIGSEMLIITTMDGCLYAYTADEWKKLEEKAVQFSNIKPEDKTFMRIFFGGAMECPMDKLGRILIPQPHRDYADIQKDVIFTGMLKRIEIWSKERFEDRYIKPSLEADKFVIESEMANSLGI